MSTLAIGPAALGITLDADASVDDDGWLERALHVPVGLDGPRGILQGGVAASLPIDVARSVDRFGAPLTKVRSRLHAPTLVGHTYRARVRAASGISCHEVEIRDADRLLISAQVELAGHATASHAHDLTDLSRMPLPEPRPQVRWSDCWVCGARSGHPRALHLYPGWRDDETVVCGWFPAPWSAREGTQVVDELVVSAVLDCPTAWACRDAVDAMGMDGPLLAGFDLHVLRDAPVGELLRAVARFDGADGRRLRVRGALVDEDGVAHAVAGALHVAVPDLSAFTGPAS
ncbi:MAG: hypothetical protein WD575_00060 [Nitriliruptoraceae bacterium]